MYGYGHFYIKNSLEEKCVMMQNKYRVFFFSCPMYEIKLGNTEAKRVGITSPVLVVRE